jgi:serine/threonine protein kinase
VTQIEFACQDEAYIYFFMKMAIGGDCYPFVRDSLCFSYLPNADSGEEADKVRAFEKLGERAIVFILAAVVLGLESLHSLNVIYRDLKP